MRINVIIGAFASLPPAPAGAIEKVWPSLPPPSRHRVTRSPHCAPRGRACPPARRSTESVTSGAPASSAWVRPGELALDYRYSRAMRKLLPPRT